jgi:hypothetical protein
MYDRFEQLALDAQLAVGILGNPTTSEFALIDLTGPDPLPDFRGEIALRGFCFIGVAGLVLGVPRTALAVPLDNAEEDKLSQAYIRHVTGVRDGRIHAATPSAPTRAIVPGDDSEQFLWRLWSLKDPRPE